MAVLSVPDPLLLGQVVGSVAAIPNVFYPSHVSSLGAGESSVISPSG